MKKIKLTQGKHAVVDEEDFEYLNQFKWFYHNMGYACRKTKLLMHRAIMNPQENMEVDHINGDTLDNRKENLRIVTHKQNIYNSKLQKNSTSRIKGVRFFKWDKRKKPWQAYICPDGKFINLGYFVTSGEAKIAYQNGSIKYYGEYAKH